MRLWDFLGALSFAPTGVEPFAHFLVSISPLLLSAGMVFGYLEFKAPGTMVGAVLAAFCFLLFFFGYYAEGLSGYEPVALFAVGAVLVAVEILFLPGLVFPVAAGFLLIMAAFLDAMAGLPPDSHTLPTLAQLRGPLLHLLFSGVLAAGIIAVLAKFLPKTRFSRSLAKATIVGAPVLTRPASHVQVGQEGEAITYLRPAGTAAFGTHRIDVVSDGGFVPAGTRVRVTQIEGIRIIVRPI